MINSSNLIIGDRLITNDIVVHNSININNHQIIVNENDKLVVNDDDDCYINWTTPKIIGSLPTLSSSPPSSDPILTIYGSSINNGNFTICNGDFTITYDSSTKLSLSSSSNLLSINCNLNFIDSSIVIGNIFNNNLSITGISILPTNINLLNVTLSTDNNCYIFSTNNYICFKTPGNIGGICLPYDTDNYHGNTWKVVNKKNIFELTSSQTITHCVPVSNLSDFSIGSPVFSSSNNYFISKHPSIDSLINFSLIPYSVNNSSFDTNIFDVSSSGSNFVGICCAVSSRVVIQKKFLFGNFIDFSIVDDSTSLLYTFDHDHDNFNSDLYEVRYKINDSVFSNVPVILFASHGDFVFKIPRNNFVSLSNDTLSISTTSGNSVSSYSVGDELLPDGRIIDYSLSNDLDINAKLNYLIQLQSFSSIGKITKVIDNDYVLLFKS